MDVSGLLMQAPEIIVPPSQSHEQGILARLDDHPVKRRVGIEKCHAFFGILKGPFGIARKERPHFIDSAWFDTLGGKPSGKPVNDFADFEPAKVFLERRGSHSNPPARNNFNQPFLVQTAKGFSNGCPAHAKDATEVCLAKRSFRRCPSRDLNNVLFEALVDLFTEVGSGRDFLSCYGHEGFIH